MIIVRAWEGLGNQLFQYAFARAISLRTREQIKIDKNHIFGELYEEGNVKRDFALQHFNITLECANEYDLSKYSFLERKNLLQKVIFFLSVKRIWKYSFYEEKKEDFAPDRLMLSRNSYIKGWFQNEKYFAQYRDVLLRELTLKKDIEIGAELQELLDRENTVSIHKRRGDYKRLGLALNTEYYRRAILHIQQYVKNPHFLVFSNEIDWVKSNMEFPSNTYYVNEKGNLKDYEELMLMSYCKHNIISNSTFSWWGAWLNRNEDKKIITPKRWVFLGINKNFHIAPKRWIRV